MGFSLYPILAIVIMTEQWKRILQPLVESVKLKFCVRSADDRQLSSRSNRKKIIWVRLLSLGQIGEKVKKKCFEKVQKCLTEKSYLSTRYN